MNSIMSTILVLATLALLSTNALAHMGVDPPMAVAGERVIVSVRIGHDCGDETVGTTNFTVVLPPFMPSVSVEQMPHWRTIIHKRTESMVASPPMPGVDGEEVEYVHSITYLGFLPDSFYQLFNIRIKMPETPGAALWFSGYQDCHNQGTSIAWATIPSAEDPEPRYPARNITLVTAEEMMHKYM